MQVQRPCREILIHGACLVPKARDNILSVSELTSEFPSHFKFGSNGFVMKSLDTNKVITKGIRRNRHQFWANKSCEFQRIKKSVKTTNGNSKNDQKKCKSALFGSTKLQSSKFYTNRFILTCRSSLSSIFQRHICGS